MNKVFVRLYAFFCSIVLIATLGFFAYRLVKSSKEDSAKAEKNFKYIANFISTSSETIDIASTEFLEKLQELCVLSGNIDKAMLTNSNNEVIFSWDAKTNKITKTPYTLQNNSVILKPYSMSISVKTPNVQGTKLYNFSAILKTLSDDLIYNGIRDCLFVFVVLFLITLMMLIINYLLIDNTKATKVSIIENDNRVDIDVPSSSDIEEKTSVDYNKNYSLDDLADVNFSVPPKSQSSSHIEKLELPKFDNFENAEPFSVQAQPSESTTNASEIASQESYNAFSKNTGVSSAEYLDEKLEFELGRATSSEQDLSLIIFMLKDIEQNLLKEVANILIHRFKFRDMIFEFGETGFAVIYHDANLEKSMQEAENAYIDILQILSREEIGIGITTRSSRLVSAKRLIDEASSAVGKSFDKASSPIVAFRPDPQAYRNYIKEYT